MHICFDSLSNAAIRCYLNNIGTTFTLSKQEVDELRKQGAALLELNESYQKFRKALAP